MKKAYGTDASSKLARIINSRHWNRLTSLLESTKGTKFSVGGSSSTETLFIPPTVITDLKKDDAVFQSEIFGPVLPILTFASLSQVPGIVADIDRTSLGLYIFTEDMAEADMIRRHTASGGMAINDVMGHVAVTSLAFGGNGTSGIGSYRGKAGIDTLSHRKSVATVPTSADFEALIEWRYVDGDQEAKFQAFKTNLEGKLDESEN
jgi:acyl-CoA reductase-like NAD-dependent aldehyde dehydrogenase